MWEEKNLHGGSTHEESGKILFLIGVGSSRDLRELFFSTLKLSVLSEIFTQCYFYYWKNNLIWKLFSYSQMGKQDRGSSSLLSPGEGKYNKAEQIES